MRHSIPIIAAFVLALAPAALAADNTPVLGKWTSKSQTPQGAFEVVFEFTEVDGKLSGTWSGPRRSGELSDVSWDGETLTFGRQAGRGGRTFQMKYEVAVDGDTMTGKMTTPRGERDFTANRSE